MDEDSGLFHVAGLIVFYSFISIVVFFMSMLVLGGFNNFVLQKVYSVVVDLVSSGVVSSVIGDVVITWDGLGYLVPYLDKLWLIGFISFIFGSVVVSYNARRLSYFGVFSFSVIGLVIFTYIGGIFIDLTSWFQINVLEAVFPNLLDSAPIFSWYLDNLGLINLFLLVVCVIANFVEFDFDKFFSKKGFDNSGGSGGEI